jgi:predicted nucleotidyltransferase component of viral defense system
MTKEIAKSRKAKLLNIAQQGNLDYQTVIIRYFYERLLYRLSVSQFREKFCLKGGTLLYALAKDTPRPTLDIDFLGINLSNEVENIKNTFTEVLCIECEDDAVFFDPKTIETKELTGNKLYAGIRISYVAHLDSIRQQMQIDIGFGDVITPAPKKLRYPVFFTELPTPEIFAYSLETVVAEKFHAMIELSEANSRFKDFYDVYKIFTTQEIDNNILIEAIKATFQNRKTIFRDNHPLFTDDFFADKNRVTQWQHFLRKIKQDDDLSFETVMALIRVKLQPVYETLPQVV